MWGLIVACVVTFFIVWTKKWNNPKCKGKLPPGSMGLPIIGESIQLLISPSHSLDILPFFKKRLQRYGSVFKTSLAGRRVVVTADPEINHFLFLQEGKSVEMWYLDSFAQLFKQDGTCNSTGETHKYLRSVIVDHFGHERMKDKLLNKVEKMARERLDKWSSYPSVDLKRVISIMVLDFITMELFSYDPKTSSENFSELFINFLEGLMSLPLNIPGTTFHKCLKNQKKILKIMRDAVIERTVLPEKRHDDLLDGLIQDMLKKNDGRGEDSTFLNEDLIVYTMFGLLFASFESIPSTLTLAVKLISEHPTVMEQLTNETDATVGRRESTRSSVTWQGYKSMNFTHQVINETLRMANVGIGILRRALKDVYINGYTIPQGWSIMILPAALHVDETVYPDPLTFNPGRWKEEMESRATSKNFTPFGGGIRSCAGADFSKMFIAVFLHVLVADYRWAKIKGGGIIRNPIIGFKDGYHIKVSEKNITKHKYDCYLFTT